MQGAEDDSPDLEAIATKLSAARTRLIIDKPFLGALVLRLPLEAADPKWCKTTATDAKKFFYNARYIEQLNLQQTQFILAHEALHCALSHFARRQHRDKHRWDLACDLAINPILVKEGLTLPPGALVEQGFTGMTAEEIYPSIEENCEDETLDEHLYDDQQQGQGEKQNPNRGPMQPENAGSGQGQEGKPQQPDQSDGEHGQRQQQGESQQNQGNRGLAQRPPPLTQQERDDLQIQWQQRLAGAAQQAMQAGKLGSDMARMVDYFLQPQLPWRSLMAQFITSTARDDYSYTRPSTRRGDPAVYPSLRSGQLNLTVAVDTSGSIDDQELSEFLSEIDAIKGQVRARVVLLACDAEIAEAAPWVYEPWDPMIMPPSISGGGGTDFRPVFEWLEAQDQAPDLLIYFTDAEGPFPEQAPYYPVIWLVKGHEQVPWGQRIQLN